ncbi:MAG: hypothetical protein ACTSPY_17740 [Candidatus Helarchaeota archaeon]
MKNKITFGKIMLYIIIIVLLIQYVNVVNNKSLNYKFNNQENINSNDMPVFNEMPYINVSCYSESVNNSIHLDIKGNSSDPSTNGKIYMKLPSPPSYNQWLSQNTSVSIYNFFDNRTWGKGNNNFTSGNDSGAPSVDQTDPVSYFHNDSISNWTVNHFDSTSPYPDYNDMTIEYDSANDYVDLSYYGYFSGGTYRYDQGEFVGIEQLNFDVPRGKISNAWIKVIYEPVHWATGSAKFQFAVKINQKEVYSRNNQEVPSGLVNTGWVHTLAWENTSNVFPSPSQDGYSNFNISLVLEFILSGQYQSSAANYQRVRIYGFYLAIEAAANPNATGIQLQVNNQTVESNTFGNGRAEILNDFSRNNPYELVFKSNAQNTDLDINFDVDVHFHAMSFVASTMSQNENDKGVKYDVDSINNLITFKFFIYTYWDLVDFFNFNFNFSIPADWNLTLVKNPALNIVFNRTSGLNYGILGGNSPDGYIELPTKNGSGSTLGELAGWWYFEAVAPNYLSDLKIYKKVGSNWVESTQFSSAGYNDGDRIKISATINNGTGVPPGISSSSAYVKIILPNGSVYISEKNGSINSNTGLVTFGPYTLAGLNTTGGIFQVKVYWNHSYDYYSGYTKVMSPKSYYYGVAYSENNFTLIHTSSLSIINPIDAQTDLKADLKYLDVFSLKVFLNDTDSNGPISESTVSVNWTGVVNLTDDSAGLYSKNFDTADLGGPGIYYLRINSTKNGYTDSSIIMQLNITAKSVLDSLITPPPVELGNNLSAKLFYHMPGNNDYNYTGAIINVSTSPNSGYLIEGIDYSYTDFSDGSYNITIFTGLTKQINSSGEFKIYVHASKEYIDSAIKEISLFIDPISSDLTTNKTFYSIYYNQNATIYVNYTRLSDSSPILGATINITGYENLNYSITEKGDGIYSIEINGSSSNEVYDLTITVNKESYKQSSVGIILSVNPYESELQYISGQSSIHFRSNLTLLVLFSHPNNTNNNYTSASISVSSQISSNYWTENTDFKVIGFSNGTYKLTIYTGESTKINQTGQNLIHIHGSRWDVQNATLSYTFYIEPIQATLTTNKSYFSVEVLENITIYVNYTSSLDLNPILGASVNLTGHENLKYTINEKGSGIYAIEINSSSTSKEYNIIITLNKSGYEQKSVSIILSVNLKESTLQFVSGANSVYLRNNLTILIFYTSPSGPNINYTGANIKLSSEINSNYWTENVHFEYTANLNGTYTITIYTGDLMKVNNSGQAIVHIHANKTNVQDALLSFSFYVNPIQTNLTTNQSTYSADFNEEVIFYVNYTEVLTYNPILNAIITISGQETLNYTISEKGNGVYSITINTSIVENIYNIIITANLTNYQRKSVAFILLVNIPESELQYYSGNSEVYFRNNLTFKVLYCSPSNESDNFTGANIQISSEAYSDYWTENVHYIVIDNLNGTYTITIFTGESTKINGSGQAVIYIHASKSHVQNAILSYNIFVNFIQTSLTTNESFISAYINENITCYVNFTETLNSNPILNANIELSGQESLSYKIQEVGNGIYSVEINCSDTIRAYNLLITANKSGFEIKTVAIILNVNPYDSVLQYISGLTSINYRNNLTIKILYSKFNDSTINFTGATIRVSSQLLADYWTESVNYIIVDNLDGTYNLTIFTGELEKINQSGQNIIHIYANKIGVKNATMTYNFYVEPIQTQLITNKSYFTAELNTNITIYVNYTASLDSSPVLGADVNLTGYENLKFTIEEKGNGIYAIEINSSSTSNVYNLIITLNRTNYEQKSISIILSVNLQDSTLQFLSGENMVYFRNNLSILVFYSTPTNPNINYTGATIKLSSELYSDYWTENVHFKYIDNLNGTYTIIIFTGEIMKINTSGQAIVHIHANKTNVQNALLSFAFYVNPIQANLTTNKSTFSVNFFENVTFYVNYTTILTSNPILNANISISGQENLNYTINDKGNGIYSVELNASSIGKVYNVIITAVADNYEQKSLVFTLLVNIPEAVLTYVSGESEVYFKNNLTFKIIYSSPYNQNENYTGANIQISSKAYTDYWTENVHYTMVDNLNGTYTLTIFTGETMKVNGSGQTVIYIHASKPNVQNATLSYNIFVNAIQSSLNTNKSYISAIINENVTYYINFTSTIDYSPLIGARIQLSGQENLSYKIRELGSGIYSIEINSSSVLKTYNMFITANKSGYEIKTIAVILTVNPFDSTLQYVSGPSTIDYRDNLTIRVLYSKLNDPNVNYSGAIIQISSEIFSDYWNEITNFIYIDNMDGTYNITIFTGESEKINRTGQNVFHIHVSKSGSQNATLSYTFYINPIETNLLINSTVFEIPKYEIINFTVKYQTKIGEIPLDGANITVLGYSSYQLTALSNGLYNIKLMAENNTGSYTISIIIQKQNYAIKVEDIVLIIRELKQYTELETNTTTNSVTVGDTTEFSFKFYYSYNGEYFTEDNISVKYEWRYGSGNLEVQNGSEFILRISTGNIPAGQYQIKIYLYDKNNSLINEYNAYLTVNSVPVSPWVYMGIGGLVILAIMLISLTYYYKVLKPKRIYKNKLLMENYYKYVDSHNLQRMLIIHKDSGLKIGSKNYGSPIDIDEDLVSGFIQAISNFGKEISQLDTAVMENISYKGFKILIDSGKYVDICLLLKEHEKYTLKEKIKNARTEFEYIYESQLQNFTGNMKIFADIYDNFDEKFEIYLTGDFHINYKEFHKRSKSYSELQRNVLKLMISISERPFKISKILEMAKSKIKAQEPVIFSAIYSLILTKVIEPITSTITTSNDN